MSPASSCLARPLAIVSGEDAPNRQILVEIRPVQAERRKLNVIQLLRRLAFQAPPPRTGKASSSPLAITTWILPS
jgi:hypothetical protein